MKRLVLFVLCVVVAGYADAKPVKYAKARRRKPTSDIQMLPTRVEYEANADEPAPESSGKRPTSIGLELGSLGRGTNANADVLGLQLLIGGRIVGRIPIWQNIYFKPGLGYFFKSERSGSATGVTQHSFDIGGTLQYVFTPEKKFRPIVGVSPRFEAIMSNISAFGSSGSSPLAFRFRMGPNAGFMYSLDRQFNLMVDLEGSVAFTNPVRPYGGLTAGVMYRID